ncbi:MAG: amidohydrolase family protein [Bacteroidetes bacterium]|nr:amidohydrolase family protein [Bacteroidota bacterium]MDA0873952.1 amidohydrolase family protein [Bacteroidota bacterium]
MRPDSRLPGLLCALLLSCLAPLSHAQVTAFVDVRVIPMDTERVLEGHTVLVEGDRIVAVGPRETVPVPADAVVIEGRGRHLMPGLAEMHGHIPPPNQPAETVEEVLFLYLANGITTVRGMLGYPGQLDLRERANRGDLASPTLYLAGPSFNGNAVSSPAQAEERVRAQAAEGWDLLKIHPGLSREQYDAMARTANSLGIRFGGHVPADVGLDHALDMGQETFDHVDGYVEALGGGLTSVNVVELNRLVQKTIQKGAWIVPTMALWETLFLTTPLEDMLAYDELKYVPQTAVDSWSNQYRSRASSGQYDPATSRAVIDLRMRVLGALSDAGARILMGTDAPQQFSVPGFSLHREMLVMAGAGMSPRQIMVSGTRNVGDYFAHKDTFGRVAAGHRADLLLLESNPLEDISRIADHAGVMVRGTWYSRAEIDARLATIAAKYAR